MRKTLEERFWEKVQKTETCWNWIGSRDDNGYGRIGFQGANRHAHRVLWIMLHGPIVGDLSVCHTCDNPRCVNPDHLFLGTRKDNTQDCRRKGRMGRRDRGEEHRIAKLTANDVLRMRELYDSKQAGFWKLGKMFKVAKSTAMNAVKGKTWSHIKERKVSNY